LLFENVQIQMKSSNPTIIFERRLPGLSSRGIDSFVLKASHAAGLRGAVSVLITGNSGIRNLNARFRGKDLATDVLSFPTAASADKFAGDIAISLDIAAHNARLLGHSVSDEIRILILHGILHLAGYDHQNDRGEMAEKEILLRRRFALPSGLIERGSKATAREKSEKAAPVLARTRR
jgi:probable rRNA maturation factor